MWAPAQPAELPAVQVTAAFPVAGLDQFRTIVTDNAAKASSGDELVLGANRPCSWSCYRPSPEVSPSRLRCNASLATAR